MTQTLIPPTQRKRLLSLDILRGITVAGMILVNNPGSWGHIYAPLRHEHGMVVRQLTWFSHSLSSVWVPLCT